MGAFGALNGRKVYPSFCSNSRYYCTVYKDKILCSVFNIDNPWTNIFLPVCQSQKCQWQAGRHPRAGSLSLIKSCAPLVLDKPRAGHDPAAEPPSSLVPASSGPPARCAGQRVPTSQPHHSPHMLEHHLTTQVVYGPSQGPTEKGMMKILRKGFGGKPTGMQRAAALLRSVQGSSPIAETWCDSQSPFAGASSIDLDMVRPEGWHLNPFVTGMWRNSPDAPKHLRELCPPAMDAQGLKCLLGTFGNLVH